MIHIRHFAEFVGFRPVYDVDNVLELDMDGMYCTLDFDTDDRVMCYDGHGVAAVTSWRVLADRLWGSAFDDLRMALENMDNSGMESVEARDSFMALATPGHDARYEVIRNGCKADIVQYALQDTVSVGYDHDDSVNHPVHYTSGINGHECIEFSRHLDFDLGNAFKYVWRAGQKGDPIEDLDKAVWYLRDWQEHKLDSEAKDSDLITTDMRQMQRADILSRIYNLRHYWHGKEVNMDLLMDAIDRLKHDLTEAKNEDRVQ